MLYGLNFNRTPIPEGLARYFAKRLNANFRGVGADKGCAWLLVGVATTAYSLDRAIAQATNGIRRLHVVERSRGERGKVYGIYAG